MSEEAVKRRLSSRQWRRVSSGTYHALDHPWTPTAALRAAVLGAGKDAVAHGLSAAWWHGLLEKPDVTRFVTIPRKRCVTRIGNVEIRRRDLDRRDLAVVRGLAVTGVPLSVLEAGDSVLMDRALQLRVKLPMLREVHDRNARRDGAAEAGRLLAVAESGGRSEAERLLHSIFRRWNIRGWTAQFEVQGYLLDAAFEEERLGIEVDGWRFHRDAARNSADLRRQNILVNAGWRLLRYDWHRLDSDPDGVAEEIRLAIGKRLDR